MTNSDQLTVACGSQFEHTWDTKTSPSEIEAMCRLLAQISQRIAAEHDHWRKGLQVVK